MPTYSFIGSLDPSILEILAVLVCSWFAKESQSETAGLPGAEEEGKREEREGKGEGQFFQGKKGRKVLP